MIYTLLTCTLAAKQGEKLESASIPKHTVYLNLTNLFQTLCGDRRAKVNQVSHSSNPAVGCVWEYSEEAFSNYVVSFSIVH